MWFTALPSPTHSPPPTQHTHTNTRANGCLSKYNNQTFLLEMEGEKGMEWKLYHSARWKTDTYLQRYV